MPAGTHLMWTLLPIRPTSFILFITVFGGLGYILTRMEFGFVRTLLVALLAGYALATLINVLLTTLRRMQNTAAPLPNEAIGRSGIIINAVASDGFGRVRYEMRNESFSAPARHIRGHGLAQGAQVVIRDVRGAVLYVEERPL